MLQCSCRRTLFRHRHQVFAILHDVPTLAKLNSLVKDIKRYLLKERTCVVTDPTCLFGTINYSFVRLQNCAIDGLDSVVRAPLGVVLRQQWRAPSAQDGRSTLTEIVSLDLNAAPSNWSECPIHHGRATLQVVQWLSVGSVLGPPPIDPLLTLQGWCNKRR